MEESNEPYLQEIKILYQNFKSFSQSVKMAEPNVTTNDNGFDQNMVEIISKTDSILIQLPKDSKKYFKLLAIKASIMYEKGKVFLSTSQFGIAKELLLNALNLIKDYANEPQISFLYLRIVNHLSYVYSRVEEFESAKELLENVTNFDDKIEPIVYSTEDLFTENQIEKTEARSKLHKLLINNMQMLGWLYGKMGLTDLHTAVQHKSLQKQVDLGDVDALSWAIKCTRLASLFLTQNKWTHARYHLAAAETVMDRLELQLNANVDLNKAQAELARAWIHYGLHLFSISKKMILEHVYVNEDPAYLKSEQNCEEEPLPEEFGFTGMALDVPTVPSSQIHNLEKARELFVHTQKWLKRSRLFYTLRDYPIDYVNSVLDLSELYRFLAFYESDIDSQYNVQKKRYDSLEALCTLLKEVRPNSYTAISVELLRELVDVQIELMTLNLKRLHGSESNECEANLKERINAVSNIQTKLSNLDEIIEYAEPSGQVNDLQDNLKQPTSDEKNPQ